MVKLSIRRKVLFIMLAGVLATLMAVGGVALYGMSRTQQSTAQESKALENFLSDSLGAYTENLAKERLKDITITQARHLDRELLIVQEDVEYMADAMHLILTAPEKYLPRQLPDTRVEHDIFFGMPYIHYSSALLQQGITPAMQAEIGRAANFADVLLPMSKSYRGYSSSLYAGSKNGYLLCLDLTANDNGPASVFPDAHVKAEFLASYDPRERTWYKQGENTIKPVFSSVYMGAEGNLDITCAAPYYDADGFAGVVGISYTVEDIYQTLVEHAMQQKSNSFVLDSSGRVIFSSEKAGVLSVDGQARDIRQAGENGLAETAKSMTAGESGVVSLTIADKSYYLAYAPMPTTGWSLGVLLGTSEVMDPVEQVKDYVVTNMEAFQKTMHDSISDILLKGLLLLIPLLFLLMYASAFLAERITKPIRRLAEGAKEIAKGDFDQKFSLNSGDELENLAASFNFMTDELKKYTENMAKAAAEKERSRTELKVAAKIQTDMLPRNFADFDCQPEFDIYALMEPAKNVGGDFYDFYMLQGRYLVITVADVSGKGVPAALFMAKSQSVLKNCVLRINNPEDMAGVLTEANKELCSNNDAAMFVTVFIGALDLQTGHFTYASGGHCPPVLGQDGHYEFVSMATNCVLGLMEMPYIQQSLDLKPQDTLFVYTDGVSEAMNEQRKIFTEARIKTALNDLPAAQPVTDILQQMYAVIRQYAGNAEQSDDITMLGLRYNG